MNCQIGQLVQCNGKKWKVLDILDDDCTKLLSFLILQPLGENTQKHGISFKQFQNLGGEVLEEFLN